MAGTRQDSTVTERTRRSVPLTRDQWAALKEIARIEQRSMQSQPRSFVGPGLVVVGAGISALVG